MPGTIREIQKTRLATLALDGLSVIARTRRRVQGAINATRDPEGRKYISIALDRPEIAIKQRRNRTRHRSETVTAAIPSRDISGRPSTNESIRQGFLAGTGAG